MIDLNVFSRGIYDGKKFVDVDLGIFYKHILNIGGEQSNKSRNIQPLRKLFGNRFQFMLEMYPFVILPSKRRIKKDSKRYIMGGFANSGIAHLGNFIHINSINSAKKIKDKVISFNDLDTRTSVAKTPYSLRARSIKSFYKICCHGTVFQKRTENKTIMGFFEKFEREIKKSEFDKTLNMSTNIDERKSLNIQAAAYLAPQFRKSSFIIGFDAIEEASRAVWINYVAQKYNLCGFIDFISMQLPSTVCDGLKMGKSSPFGNIKVGDSLTESINKLKFISDEKTVRITWFMVDSIFRTKAPKVEIKFQDKDIEIGFSMYQKCGLFYEKFISFNDWILVLNRLRQEAAWKQYSKENKKEDLKGILFNARKDIISFSAVYKIAKIFYRYARLVKRNNSTLVFTLPVRFWRRAISIASKDIYSYNDLFQYVYRTNDGEIQKFKLALLNTFNRNASGVFL